MAADDALEAAEVVDVGHGAHHEVVGGQHHAAPVTLHSEDPGKIFMYLINSGVIYLCRKGHVMTDKGQIP